MLRQCCASPPLKLACTTNSHGVCSETQYRRWFRQWGVRKRILATEKQDIVGVLGRRNRADASTSNVTLGNDKQVDKKQLKRHLKDEIRHRAVEKVTPGV